MPDIPPDFKIEFDRLVNELSPKAERLSEILKELPRKSQKMVIKYETFTLTIKRDTWN